MVGLTRNPMTSSEIWDKFPSSIYKIKFITITSWVIIGMILTILTVLVKEMLALGVVKVTTLIVHIHAKCGYSGAKYLDDLSI